MEIRLRVDKHRVAQLEKARDVPALDHLFVAIDVHREVEKIADEDQRLRPLPPRISGLQDVQPLDDEDVGLKNSMDLALDDVIDEVRINRCADLGLSAFYFGQEADQPALIVTFRKPF